MGPETAAWQGRPEEEIVSVRSHYEKIGRKKRKSVAAKPLIEEKKHVHT